jgi:GDP-4-dehydro-6-deoxy-D-mannose reductase
MDAKLLVTGAGGFLGRHVVDAMLRQGFDAAGLVTATRGPSRLPPGVETRDVDLSRPDAARSLIDDIRPDRVLHLAGAASVAVAGPAGAETAWRDNAETTLAIVGALREAGGSPTVLLASSAEVYGRGLAAAAPTTEDCPPAPRGVYGRTKLAAEQIVGDVIGGDGRGIILRLFNSAGPGQDERFVISAFAAQIARIEAGLVPPVLRVGNLDPERDFLDVRDTARAWALLADAAPGLARGVSYLNVASGEARSVRSIVDALARMARRSFAVETDPARARASDVPRACGDAGRLRTAVGWQPRIPWATTLADTLDHWRSEVARSG